VMIDTCQKLLITPRGDLSTPRGVINYILCISVSDYYPCYRRQNV